MQLIDVSSACIHDVVASSDAGFPLSYGKVCLLMALPQPFTFYFFPWIGKVQPPVRYQWYLFDNTSHHGILGAKIEYVCNGITKL